MWCPLTPPINETDVFIDGDELNTTYLYDTEPLEESLLPPVYYTRRNENKRSYSTSSPSKSNKKQATVGTIGPIPVTTTSNQSSKVSAGSVKIDNILMPRPLFDKTNNALLKLRRDIKMQKLKGWTNYKLDVIKSTLPIQQETILGKDDWLPNDDFIVLHVRERATS
jgi:hypothetical protein